MGDSLGCIEATGYADKDGYRFKRVDGKLERAHRYAYEQHNGSIPAGVVVMHTCDNPACINPEHLVAGTHQDNMTDKVSKSRQKRGENDSRGKLTETQVKQIRCHSLNGLTALLLAKMFGVGDMTIHRVITNKLWSHVS